MLQFRSAGRARALKPVRFRRISAFQLPVPPMDLRLVLVATPILLAAGWAVFHIGRAAVGQLQLFIKRAG